RDAEVRHLSRLGEYAVKVGEPERGLTWLQEAITAITPDLECAHFFRCITYENISHLMREKGNVAEAVRYAEMAVGEARLDGNPEFVANAQLVLARAERARGERLEALRLVEELLVDARQHSWKAEQQEGEWLRAELERDLGHPAVAEQAAWHA